MSYSINELELFKDRELLEIFRDALKTAHEEMERREVWRVFSQDRKYGTLQPVWSPEYRTMFRLIEDILIPLDVLLERLIENG